MMESEPKKKIDLWTIVNSINSSKEMEWEDIEKLYEPYIINKAMSYFPDTILFADDMNKFYDLPKKLQYLYYINNVKPKKRFSKWAKKNNDESLDLVKKYFNYNDKKAEAALKILTTTQIKMIKEKQEIGGLVK